MSNTANVDFQIINNAGQVSIPLTDIVFVQGKTVRGPVSDPSDIITSWAQFKRLFGGYTSSSNLFPLLCMRLLNRGAKLRVNRLTDGAEALAETKDGGVAASFVDGALALFSFVAKHDGADYNNITVEVKDASNGNANYFNIEVTHATDDDVYELYENLTITGAPTIANSDYLLIIAETSDYIVPVYKDASTGTAPLRPENDSLTLAGGSDGGTLDLADYTGDSGDKTGFYAFDGYDEAFALICPDISESDLAGISAAGEGYASGRKDLRYYQHLDNSNTDPNDLISERPDLDSKYIAFTAGGLYINDPLTSTKIAIPEVADVIGCMVYTFHNFKPWYAINGPVRGIIPNVLGVVNNFGSQGSFADLNLLANNQINMVILRDRKIMLWDGYTALLGNNPEKFISINNLLLYIQKTLRPFLEAYLGEPNDMQTWKNIYLSVLPFLDSLVTDRGLFSYQWNGDQFATSLSDLQVNTQADVLQGKYTIDFRITPIVPLVEIKVKIVITPQGVSFE